MSRSKSSFLSNTGVVTAGQVVRVMTATVLGILTANYLGPGGKGQVRLAMTTGIMVGQLVCLGFDQATPYFLGSRRLSSSQVLGAWVMTIVMGLAITYGVVYPVFLVYFGDSIFRGVSPVLILTGGLICPVYMLRLLVNKMLAGYEAFFRQAYHNFAILGGSLLGAVLSLVVIGYGPLGYVGFHVGFAVLSLILGVYLLLRVVPFEIRFEMRSWLKMFCYGIKSMLHQLLNLVDLRFDMYIVNYFVNTSAVGIYTVAASLGNAFWLLSNSVSMVLLPRSAGLGRERSNYLTSVVCRNVMWLTILGGGFFLLVSRPIIVFVYGEAFEGASLALALLMPGVIGQAVSRICFTDCAARGYPGKATLASGITASLTIGLDLILIPRYEIRGAAAASSIAYCTSGFLGIYWHVRLSGNRVFNLLLPRASDLKLVRNGISRIIGRNNKKEQGG